MINTRNYKPNLYIGKMEIVNQGEPRLGQTKWIPRKVANISLPLSSLRSEFRDAKHEFKQQLDYLSMELQDMENAVNELDYPVKYIIKNLFEIKENSSRQIIKEEDEVEYMGRIPGFGMPPPMHYFIISVSESDGTAFVATGYQIALLVGGGYHEVCGNIHKKPRMISSQCVWRS